METNEMREKLTEYIKVADEKKVTALYKLLEYEVEINHKWWEDNAFVAELNEDVRKIESGEEKGFTEEEVYSEIDKRLKQHMAEHV